MREIGFEEIASALADACIKACSELPEDVVAALGRAYENEDSPFAKETLRQVIENARMAKEQKRPCCQDTGLAVVFAELGREVHLTCDLEEAVNEGVRRGYKEGYLRKSSLTALSRVNMGDNTPAVLHVKSVAGDRLKLTVAPKGFGSENKGMLHMLTPAAGVEGVLSAVVETVQKAGGGFCPPGIVGVGVGGTMETACLLAKKQLLRPVGEPSPDPELAKLEAELLSRINALSIGPMGLGGKTTVLAVHMAQQPTHIAGLPVAVNLQCHAARHAEVIL